MDVCRRLVAKCEALEAESGDAQNACLGVCARKRTEVRFKPSSVSHEGLC